MRVIKLKNIAKQYHKREYFLSKKDVFWALEDISFSVENGESVGIIGPNGAGKTTLMRIISGITLHTRGEVSISGKVVPLISIEGALNYVLTARENMLLLSTALGVEKSSQAEIFDKIIKFSAIEDYLDMQVFKLSSGMISRFAFSIAAHVPSDIILIDEVLAVGDQSFQKKCFKKIEEFKERGKTIIYISHDLRSMENICPRVLWVDEGKIIDDGAADNIIPKYIKFYENKK
jgi:ABC-type polysaccharide/polyol phosphate transport system ATPase subunit